MYFKNKISSMEQNFLSDISIDRKHHSAKLNGLKYTNMLQMKITRNTWKRMK